MTETTTSTRRSGHPRSTGPSRVVLLGAALTASAVALTGCGSDDEEAATSATRTSKPTPAASQSVTASAQSSQTPTASDAPTASASGEASASASATEPLPIPSGSYATIWPAPAGTVPGRCGGNGMDERMYLNGWELCWTGGTISEPFAVNVAQTLAVNNFASGVYDVPSPVGMRTIECTNFLAPNTQTTIISCSGGTVTGNGAIELAWLG
jgi:hypothetical protein